MESVRIERVNSAWVVLLSFFGQLNCHGLQVAIDFVSSAHPARNFIMVTDCDLL